MDRLFKFLYVVLFYDIDSVYEIVKFCDREIYKNLERLILRVDK